MGNFGFIPKYAVFVLVLCVTVFTCDCAKINTPRVLLPWFDNLKVNFTFEIIEGGCYTWSLSRDDIIDLDPIYEGSWGHCSRAARVSVSRTCVPPGSVIILAEEVNSGEILRGDVDIDVISSLKVVSTTWKLFLEEAPEAFEVVASDDQGNTFSTLEGLSFEWTIENIGKNYGEEPLVTLVRWRDTDYEAPKGIAELEAQGLRSHAVLLYGQGMGDARVTVCLGKICTQFDLTVVASVVLTPAIAYISQGDTINYRVVRARAGRLTVQDVADTVYNIAVPDTGIAQLYDSMSVVKGLQLGSSSVYLTSGTTEVASATLTVVTPHSIRVSIRPSNLLVIGEQFTIHCVLYDKDGHQLTAGQETLIRLTVDGEAVIDLIRSTENGTITEAVAHNSGAFTVTAQLYSIAGKILNRKVEGETSGVVIDPLEIDPPELYIAWTNSAQEVQLKHRGGGSEPVTWSESETTHSAFSLTHSGSLTVRGEGAMEVQVHLTNYPHVKAVGRVVSAAPLLVQVSSTGVARAYRPHALHVALTGGTDTGDLYNFHTCNCNSFTVTLIDGPEPQNVTAAPWIEPADGACCVLSLSWAARGACSLRVSHGRAGDDARVLIRAAPALIWPTHAAILAPATLPVLAEGEALVTQSSEPRVAELSRREGPPPHRYPEAQLFTLSCKKKGESNLDLLSHADGEAESVRVEAACAPHVSRVRLDPLRPPGDCAANTRLWLRPNHEVMVRVTLFDGIGRELLDEYGPSVSWETTPAHAAITYKSADRLFVETNPEYYPVPVPLSYYQLVEATDQSIGWSGTLKASIPDASASIQAKVVAPLRCDTLKVDIAWQGESIPNITSVEGGSGLYSVETPKGVAASVDDGLLNVIVPAPGMYDVVVTDRCVNGERQVVEVNVEEVIYVEVLTSRAVGVDNCVSARVAARGASGRVLYASRPQWRVSGPIAARAGLLCGVREGVATVSAAVAGVWSEDVEVHVFPPLSVEPARTRLPPGGRVQLRARGGPPSHLATLTYRAEKPILDVSSMGNVHALAVGTGRLKLIATDFNNVELASTEAEIEVVEITDITVMAATHTLLVGRPAPLWVAAGGLRAGALGALAPPPRVTWSVRDPTAARLYVSHIDDQLERSIVEGLTVRVVPLKPGVITIDVRVRNLGQISESRSWDSTVEILGVSDIKTSIEGSAGDIDSGERLALVVGASVRLKSLPRGNWVAYQDGAFELKENGEVRALRPGFGMIVVKHKDERNDIYRETAIHVEVSALSYCTVEASADERAGADAVRVVLRSALGRRLLGRAHIAADTPIVAINRTDPGAEPNEVLLTGVEAGGAYVRVTAAAGGASVADELYLAADARTDRVLAVGGWGVCVEGGGWRAPGAVALAEGGGVTLALLSRTSPARHQLRRERPPAALTVHQVSIDKMEFIPGEWPSSFVPLTIEGASLANGPLLCSEDQKYALDGVQIELPYSCRTKAPHTAQPVLDIPNSQLGCTIIPATKITESTEVELCAEWDSLRTCTRVLLLPLISVTEQKISLLDPQPTFKVQGHPHALKLIKMSTSPGLKLEVTNKNTEVIVNVKGDSVTCGIGWVNIMSRMTSQELRVEVQRECDIACGTLLGAILSILKPYLPTLMTIVAVAAAFLYVQMKWQQKVQIRMPMEPPSPQTTLNGTRARTWARSPYANGPATPPSPVYGDTSVLPDSSLSPNVTRTRNSYFQ
ncbi:nuclear pore membrane glycoprotein 210 [Aricia agestis]|uniref:nuclear pore membrane glycoprotein 210 n=1 Tax=Aricia agestis TaxID=91739 RepID=UPI001C20868E|nr:nuclear pore membrane glycoprotein 210 [Aricia agestis]